MPSYHPIHSLHNPIHGRAMPFGSGHSFRRDVASFPEVPQSLWCQPTSIDELKTRHPSVSCLMSFESTEE